MRTCARCGNSYPLDSEHFYKMKNHRSGWDPKCKMCRATLQRNYRQRIFADEDTRTKYNLKNRNRSLDQEFTVEEYKEMLAAQKGVCAICERPPSGKGRSGSRLHIDHDHETGKVRSLLCHPCNVALGLLQDNPIILTKAAKYLRRHRANR